MTHVAVHDSPYLVAHSLCPAGNDGRHRERHRREQDPVRLRRVLQMGSLGSSGGRWRMALCLGGAAFAFVVSFRLVLVAPAPLSAIRPTASFLDFVGPTFSVLVGGAPEALYAWQVTESIQTRSECAETGLIGRSPTTPVGTFGIYTPTV